MLVSSETTEIALEFAHFHAGQIRKTAKTHGFHTEASHRFERGTDIGILPYAAARAAD